MYVWIRLFAAPGEQVATPALPDVLAMIHQQRAGFAVLLCNREARSRCPNSNGRRELNQVRESAREAIAQCSEPPRFSLPCPRVTALFRPNDLRRNQRSFNADICLITPSLAHCPAIELHHYRRPQGFPDVSMVRTSIPGRARASESDLAFGSTAPRCLPVTPSICTHIAGCPRRPAHLCHRSAWHNTGSHRKAAMSSSGNRPPSTR